MQSMTSQKTALSTTWQTKQHKYYDRDSGRAATISINL